MACISIYEAKVNLSKYVNAIGSGDIQDVIITRNGVPAARLVPYEKNRSNRIGVAKDKLRRMPDLDAFNSINIEDDFFGNGSVL